MNWTFWRRAPSAPARRVDTDRESAELDETSGSEDAALALRRRARRRLIGAAVLLLAVAIVLPMALDEAPRPPAENIKIEIPGEKTPFAPRLALPPADPAPATPEAAPVEQEKKAATRSPAEKSDATAAKAAASVPAVQARETPNKTQAKATKGVESAPAKTQATKTQTTATKKPESAPAKNEAPKSSSKAVEPARPVAAKDGAPSSKFLLQAAALGTEGAAQDLSERLRKAGLQPFIERVDAKDGVRFRVRVGPYASRDEAQRAQSRLRALGVVATIVPVKPT